MRRFVLAGLMLAVTLAPGVSRAQDAPWPPDPEEIFADGVEVVSANPIVDNEVRQIYIYREGSWQTFSFPHTFESVVLEGYSSPALLDNGTLLLDVNERIFDDLVEDRVWLLNIETGEFTQIPLLCGEEPFYRLWELAHGDFRWTYYIVDDSRYHLCNVRTGELSPPLPNWTDWWGGSGSSIPGSHQPVASPDGAYVVFFGSRFVGCGMSQSDTLIAAYEVTTRRFLNLGIGCGHDTAYIQEWINNTQAIVYTGDMPSDFQRGYSLIDVMQEESLRGITSSDGRVAAASYYENPSRFERLWIPVEEMYSHDYHVPRGACVLNIVYVPSLETQEFDLGNDCVQMVRLNDGTYLYRDIHPDSGELAEVVHFDQLTQEQDQVLAGEIERIQSVSPDGNYAVVVIDDNGRVDENTSTFYRSDWQAMTNPQLAVYDLRTGTQVCHIAFQDDIRIGWARDDILLLRLPTDSETTARIIEFDGDAASETVIDYAISGNYTAWNLISGGRILVWSDQQGALPSVYDMATKSTIPLVQADAPAYSFRVSSAGTDSDRIYISVAQPKSEQFVQFTLRLPQPES